MDRAAGSGKDVSGVPPPCGWRPPGRNRIRLCVSACDGGREAILVLLMFLEFSCYFPLFPPPFPDRQPPRVPHAHLQAFHASITTHFSAPLPPRPPLSFFPSATLVPPRPALHAASSHSPATFLCCPRLSSFCYCCVNHQRTVMSIALVV